MSPEDYWTNCKNCGRQVKKSGDEGADEKCYFCHKPMLKKEENAMPANVTKPPVVVINSPKTVTESPEFDVVPADEPPHELYVASGKSRRTKRPGLYKWGRRCGACEHSYLQDKVRYCLIKACPQHCPPSLRPQYRAKEDPLPVKVPAAPTREKKKAATKPLPAAVSLPPFDGPEFLLPAAPAPSSLPSFNDSWPAEVQIEWFRTLISLEELRIRRTELESLRRKIDDLWKQLEAAPPARRGWFARLFNKKKGG